MESEKVAKIVLSPDDNYWHYRMYGSMVTLCNKRVSSEVALTPTISQEVLERLSGHEAVRCPECARLIRSDIWYQETIGALFRKL